MKNWVPRPTPSISAPPPPFRPLYPTPTMTPLLTPRQDLALRVLAAAALALFAVCGALVFLLLLALLDFALDRVEGFARSKDALDFDTESFVDKVDAGTEKFHPLLKPAAWNLVKDGLGDAADPCSPLPLPPPLTP